MFVRVKPSGQRRYLQIVENHREGKRTVQRVIATLGRLDRLVASGQVDGLLRSLSRFAQKVRLVETHRSGGLLARSALQIGPELAFGALWSKLHLEEILSELVAERRLEFPLERAVLGSVLHRLFASGSDRSAQAWLREVRIRGAETLELHHLYRARRFLGEEKDPLEEARYDGKFVLRTNSTLPASEVALNYKQLLLVEQFFRAAKSLWDTRPIFHQFGATIAGPVLVSLLALLLVYELKERLQARGFRLEWAHILRDLEALCEVEVSEGEQTYLLRTELKGTCGKVLQAAGAAIPPPVRIPSGGPGS